MLRRPLVDDQDDQRNSGNDRQRENRPIGEPVGFLPLVEDVLQRADADHQHADAPVVDPLRLAAQVRRIEDEQLRHDDRRNADREVDVEDPAPAVAVGQPSADDGAENRRDDDAEAPEAHGLAALVRLEGFEEHRLRQRLQGAAGRALNDAEEDERSERRREAAQKRRRGEADDRQHQQPLAAEHAREPAGHRQNDGVGDQIGRQDPGRFIDRRGHRRRDMRQRDVDDGGVEHLHEGAEHHRDGDDPRVDVPVLCHFV